MTELEKLLIQQKELEKKIAEAKAKEEALKKPLFIEPHLITMARFSYGLLYVDSKWREDIVEAMRSVPSRQFAGGSTNMFAAQYVGDLMQALGQLNNVKIVWKDGVKEAVTKYNSNADYTVSLREKDFFVEISPRAVSNPIGIIPGAKWESRSNGWSILLTEGWRLSKNLDGKRVEYSKEAAEAIEKQLKTRAKLDEIAQMKDADFDPGFLNGYKMRPFQKVSALFGETTGFNFLLCEQMGLGKTWIALGLAHKHKFRTLIVCPASLKENWRREVKKLTGVDPICLSGTKPTNYDIATLLGDKPQYVIINYDVLGRKINDVEITKDQEGFEHKKETERYLWVEILNLFEPELVLMDEAHYIKNMDSLRSKASRLLVAPRFIPMTGTPVLNRPSELFPLLYLIDRVNFPSHDMFTARYTTDGRNAKNVEELRELLKTRMIRHLKKDVIEDLPAVIPIPEYHEMSQKARKLYDKVLMGVYETLATFDPDAAGAEKQVPNILVQIMRLKQICAVDKIDRTADHAMELYDSSEGNANRKVIVFSQFKAVVKAIAKRLPHESVVITGDDSPAERMKIVDRFQNDDSIHFAICSTKAVSEGLTMTAAGSVIIHDEMWTPAAHDQAIGRAYGRLNDAHGVDAYFMLVQDSIDEDIWQLLNEKIAMINQVVEGVEKSRDVSVAMDLIRKLKNNMGR